MNRLDPQIWKIAERLLALEARENETQAVRIPAARRVCDKLRPTLGTLMGRTGFCALLSRALVLTSAEVTWPGVVQVKADGTLVGWDILEGKISRQELAKASVALIARLIGLLVTFVGEELTFRLLREIWPDEALNDGILMKET